MSRTTFDNFQTQTNISRKKSFKRSFQSILGKRCEVNIDDCESSPCQNRAPCIDGLNNYTCDCLDTGYEGIHCEINIDDCKGNPCQNGAQCIDEVKDYQCNCYKGYSGKENTFLVYG